MFVKVYTQRHTTGRTDIIEGLPVARADGIASVSFLVFLSERMCGKGKVKVTLL